jgi:heptaprenyl diphosphate synthase
VSSQPLAARVKTLDLFLDIAAELNHVQSALEAALATNDTMLGDVSAHLLKSGGKRIRPALVLLSSKFPGAKPERVTPVAVAVELIHMATLVHDDVVDRAAVRRGLPTVNSRWSNQVSVLTGDYLFAKAFSLLAGTGENRIVRIMADVVYEMSRGELKQLETCFSVDQTEEEYYDRIAQKTGYLIAECCRLGGIVAGAEESQVQALYHYGYGIGISFQIADDLLDFFASTQAVGKPVCSDLKAGILTLPVIHALRASPRASELKALIAGRNVGDAEVARVKEILEETGSFQYARDRAQQYLSGALAELDRLPDLSSAPTLRVLADFVINRQF